ncbi:TRAP transporter substrate-binding protein [Bacillus infantis]|uniref:TRAP transporter substrate-binding protein n=1 Tax=Bacillus infantis TaxID=324767 RepID=UPI003CF19BA2
MKKKTLMKTFAAVSAMTLLLAGCGSNKSSGSAQSSEDGTIELRLASHVPENHSTNKEYIEKFIELVESKSDGKVTVENYPNGQLGGQRELLEALELGSLDMSYSDVGLLANYDESIGILDLPFIFEDLDHADKALVDGVAEKIKAKIEESSQIKSISIIPVAFRGTLLKDEKIESVEDFKGLKIRVPESPVIVETFKALGANPVSIPSGEAYTAIQTDVVSGMEGHKEFIYSIKTQEVAKQWIETKHNLTFNTINISDKVFNNLTEDVQSILLEAAEEAAVHFHEKNKEIDGEYKEILKGEGVAFSEMDLEQLRKKTEPMIKKFISDNNAQDIFEIIENSK